MRFAIGGSAQRTAGSGVGLPGSQIVAHRDELAGDVVRAGAGLYRGCARGELDEEVDQGLAPELLVQDGQSLHVLTVQVQEVLAQIKAHQCHCVHDGLRRKKNTQATEVTEARMQKRHSWTSFVDISTTGKNTPLTCVTGVLVRAGWG